MSTKVSSLLGNEQNRVAFKTHHSFSRKKNLLDLVNSNLYGPMNLKTLVGSLYFVTFIDDHSRKI